MDIPRIFILFFGLLSSSCRIDTNVEGEGLVNSPNGTFNCSHQGGDCSEVYNAPETEILEAMPAPGYAFSKWSGCSRLGPLSCETTISQAAVEDNKHWSITAMFTPLSPPVQAATYSYNALGQRITKTVGGDTTLFQYDLEGRLIVELDASGLPRVQHIYTNGEPVAQLSASTDGSVSAHYVHVDHPGVPGMLTNQGKHVVADLEFTPFGERFSEPADFEYHKRFPGQYRDVETNLHYNYFRDYDPGLGRYIQSDPIGLTAGPNTYAYVDNSPSNYVDPYGLIKVYGNWCGPGWTGGFSQAYDQLDSAARSVAFPPIDTLDACCQSHDITYANCRAQFPCERHKRAQCMQDADRQLNSCAAGAGGGQSPMLLLFGNPQKRIRDYMRDSIPDGGDNAQSCECS